MLFVQGLMAALKVYLERVPRGIRYRLITICGLICLFAPLALWVSMALESARIVLAVWLGAMLVLSLMVWSSPDERI